MIEIVMFTKDDCPNCKRAEMLFEYCPVDVKLIKMYGWKRNDDDSLICDKDGCYRPSEVTEILKEKGIMSLPSFKIGDEWIEGFNEGKIKEVLGL